MRRSVLLVVETVAFAEIIFYLIARPVSSGADFSAYYMASHLLHLHETAIYNWSLLQAATQGPNACTAGVSPYLYPPLFAFLLTPLTLLPCHTALLWWTALDGIWLGASLLLVQAIWTPAPRQFALICLMALGAFPVLFGVWYGQIHLFVLCGLLFVLWRLQSHDAIGAGIGVAILSLVQVTPVLFGVCFLLQRQWRLAAASLISGLALTSCMVLLVGWQVSWAFVMNVLHGVGSNDTSMLHWTGPMGLAAIVLIYVAGVTSSPPGIRGYLWTIATMLMFSPLVWVHMLAWLLPILVAWCLAAPRTLRWLALACYCAFYLTWQFPPVGTLCFVVVWCVAGWDCLAPGVFYARSRFAIIRSSRP